MAFNIICSRAKGGKSKYVYDEIKRLTSLGEEAVLIVPEQYTHAAERKLLSFVDAIKGEGVEVFSFAHLAAQTEKLLGLSPAVKLGAVGKALTIGEILKNSKLEFFKNFGSSGGFTDIISSSLKEFKKYLITPETLAELAKKTDDEVLAMKLNDLKTIYENYENTINGRYADTDDALTTLEKRLEKNKIYSNKHIFLDEFSTFVPQEIAIIRELESQAKSLTVTLCLDTEEKGTPLFMPTRDTLRILKENISAKANVVNLKGTNFLSDDISYLEENLYRFPAKKREKNCTDISVFSAPNPGAETELAAEKIISLVRDEGYKFGEIGVICSDIAAYERHAERIFSQYNIPYFIDAKKDVVGHHIISFVLSIIEVYTNDYNFDSIFNYLKSAFDGETPEALCILGEFIEKTKLRRKTWLDDKKWNDLCEAYFADDENSKNTVSEIREKYILPLASMHEKIKGRHPVKDDIRALYDLLVTLNLPKTVENYIERFKSEGDLRLSKEYEQIWDIIITVFDEMAETCGNTLTSPADFNDMLKCAFSQNQIGYIPSTVDRVLVGNTERTRADGIKALFVLGVNEGVFPVSPKNDGVLSDSDKTALEESGVKFSTTSEIAAYYSQFSVYTALTLPSKRLFISYSKAGNDFKTLRKSYTVTRILSILNIREKSSGEIWENAENYLSSKDACAEKLCDEAARYCRYEDVNPLWRSVYDYFEKNGDFVSKMNRYAISDNIAHRLNPEHLKKLIGIINHTSVSKIQRYTACRYAYFIDYILGIKPPKEEAIDRIDIGNITHYILEKILKDISGEGTPFSSVDDDAVEAKITAMLDNFAEESARRTDEFSKRDQYIIKRLKNSIFLCYKAIKKHICESKFEPLGYEMEFGENSDLGYIQIETEDGKKINLTGKIDRADAYKTKDGTYIRVTDYKTGSKSFKLDDVFYGLDVQLIVYLNALVESNPEYKHAGALYFLIDDPLVKSKGALSDENIDKELEKSLKLSGMIVKDDTVCDGFDPKTAKIRNKFEAEKFELMSAYLKKSLGKICTDMSNGDISINPYRKGSFSPCTYCKYGSVCRFDETDENNSYNYLESISKSDEIWKKMEESINVDTKPTSGD